MLTRSFVALVLGLAVGLAGFRSEAMPGAVGGLLVPTDVTHITGGCGRGWHPGPLGCQRNWDASWPCYWVHTPFGLRLICR